MKIKEKNIQNLMTYGLDVELAQRLVDNNLTISKVREISKHDLETV